MMDPNPLTSDVAKKVLTADLQNTVAHVAAGKRLAGPERQRFEAAAVAAPSADDLSELKLRRQAALIRKWATGGKLSRDEMAEVHPILPAAVLAAPCKHVLTRRQKFARSYEDYAKFFGKGLRTVKRWASIGKAKGEPFPFDDPSRVPDWWSRNMEYSIPADVLAVCSRPPSEASSATPGAAAGANADSSSLPASPGTDPPSNRALINVHDLAAIGLKENVERLSKIHRANLELLEKAFGGSSDTELQLRQRNAEKSARMLSDAQRNLDAYQKEHGELVVLADVTRDLLRVHTTMAQSLVGILVGLGIHRERAIASVDTWFKHLRESRFASGTIPELRPPAASAA